MKTLIVILIFLLSGCAEASKSNTLEECKKISSKGFNTSSPVRKYWQAVDTCMQLKGYNYDNLKCPKQVSSNGEDALIGAEFSDCYN